MWSMQRWGLACTRFLLFLLNFFPTACWIWSQQPDGEVQFINPGGDEPVAVRGIGCISNTDRADTKVRSDCGQLCALVTDQQTPNVFLQNPNFFSFFLATWYKIHVSGNRFTWLFGQFSRVTWHSEFISCAQWWLRAVVTLGWRDEPSSDIWI